MQDNNMQDIHYEDLYDAVIIGGGPAGLTAALYLARARYRVIVVEKESFGGQITITNDVVNYPGVLHASGTEITENMRRQAQSFGAEFLLAEATSLSMDGDIKTVHTTSGDLHCFGVLFAAGAHPRMVGFTGEEEFRGHGVAYCATCDGEFFTGREIFVVGGGFAAAEESVFLTRYGKHVTILIRRDDFSCDSAVAELARQNPKITIYTNVTVEEVSGKDNLDYIRYRNTKTNDVTEYRAENGDSFGVFVFAGYEPATEPVKGIAALDDHGYIVTDSTKKTSCDGLFAAGDVCIKPLRQVVTAVGDGALAATEMEKLAAAMQKKNGLHPKAPEAKPAFSASANDSDSPVKKDSAENNGIFGADIIEQLNSVFARMETDLTLRLYLDDSDTAKELHAYMEKLSSLTDRLHAEISNEETKDKPCVRVYSAEGRWTGLSFHGVPGGHEFTSFVLGLYNAAGPGQKLNEADRSRILALPPANLKLIVSLSCTMCPELVASAQHIAAINPNITAEVYDFNLFPHLRDQYHIMSVPCMVINDGEKVLFGKKNVRQLLDILE